MSEMVQRMAEAEATFDGRPWLNMPKADRDRYLQRARKCLETMRDPTHAMVEKGRWPAEDDGPVACWQAMIDEALR